MMQKGDSCVLLIEELKEILSRAGDIKSIAQTVEFKGVQATQSLLWYETHVKILIGYGIWMAKSLSILAGRDFSEAYYIELTEKDIEADIDQLLERHRGLKKDIETTFLAYNDLFEKDRQLYVLTNEIKKNLTLADANLNQMMKRGIEPIED